MRLRLALLLNVLYRSHCFKPILYYAWSKSTYNVKLIQEVPMLIRFMTEKKILMRNTLNKVNLYWFDNYLQSDGYYFNVLRRRTTFWREYRTTWYTAFHSIKNFTSFMLPSKLVPGWLPSHTPLLYCTQRCPKAINTIQFNFFIILSSARCVILS